MVRLLTSSTTVLMPPMIQFSLLAGLLERLGILVTVDAEAEKQRAEEHHFGGQEDPHAQRRRLVLLLEVGVLLFERMAHQGRQLQLVAFVRRQDGVCQSSFCAFSRWYS